MRIKATPKPAAKKTTTLPGKGWLNGFQPVKRLGRLVACAGSGCLLALNPGLQAAPAGGQIVGGTGQIQQSGLNTTVQQHSQLMAIDWQNFNLGNDEQIRFLQPNAQAIALNRILSDSASQIHGRVDANGHLILVNPQGLIFGPHAVLNVGGLIASGLHIDPDDFINGDYLFNALDGSEGLVVNQGLIQAAVGGNVTLLGQQVVNEGLILAQLGTVTLASGRAAVLSFDHAGLLGVKITEAVLQDELGLEAGVLNSGEIQAAGGRVLLTGSASHDVFSQAVNRGDINQASSVTVHEDGSFTLSAGSDVVNNGSIDASQTLSETLPHADSPSAAGHIVLLGHNITSSGELRADGHSGAGGQIDIQARDTTRLTGNSHTSARSEQDQGGAIQVLGHKVGLFDQSTVEASGALGGGNLLIGGDYQGQNPELPNAWRTFVGADTQLRADALSEGNGGRIIVWADDSTQFHGQLSAKGGAAGGDGGFAEVSGKQGLNYQGWADLSAPRGENGSLLLDPKNITISIGSTTDDFPNDYNNFDDLDDKTTVLNNADLVAQLGSASVVLRANTDVKFEADVIASGTNSLTLEAGRSITLANNVNIALNGGDFTATINHEGARNAHRDNGNAVFNMGTGSSITTNGGAIAIDTGSFKKPLRDIEIGDITLTELNTASATGGGDITVTNSTGSIVANGTIDTQGQGVDQAGGEITLESTKSSLTLNGLIVSQGSGTGAGGKVTLTVGDDVNLNKAIQAGTGTITINGDDSQNKFSVAAGISISGSTITFNGGDGDDIFNLSSSLAATLNGGKDSDTFNLLASGLHINSIQGGGNNDTLLAYNDTLHLTTWTIDSDTAGQIDNNGGRVNYESVESITPGEGDDRFTFAAGADYNRPLDGQGGTNTLVGHDLENTWQITGANAGSFSNSALSGGGTNSLSFTNIQHLEGGDGIDRFVFSGNGAVASLQGGEGTNHLQGPDQANTWTLSAANAGRLANTNTVDFTQIQHLIGGSTQDDFYLVNRGAEHIDGGADASNTHNTLYAPLDVSNRWQIIDNDAGALDSANISFNNIGNLRGGNERDTFTFANTGSLSGLLDGGGGLDDHLDIRAINSERTVEIMAPGESANANLNILNIETLAGSDTNTTSPTRNHTLQGDDVVTTWTLRGFNTGSLEAKPVSEPSYTLDFSGIGNLSGGNRDDTFQLANGGSLTGQIDGGDQAIADTVDYSLQSGAVRVTLGSALSGVSNVENIQGNSSNSTLVGENTDNTWIIDSQNAGNVGTLSFAGFNHLEGGSGQDTFHVSGGGDITGTVKGMGGNDQLNLSLSGTETGNLTFIGGADNDTLTLDGGHSAYQGIYTGIDNGNPQNLRYTQAGNTYRIDYSELETVNDTLIADTLTVLGSSAADTLSLNSNSFQVNTATPVNYSNKTKLTVDGLGSTDTLSITGTVTLNGTLSLNNLTLPNSDASNRLQTHIGGLSLNNVIGDLYLNENNDLNLLALGLSGTLDLQAGGALTDGADLVANNTLNLHANSILLDNDNQLSGPISLTSPGSVTLNNTTATHLNTVAVQHLNLSSNGNISDDDSGSITVSGLSTLNSNGDIVLDSANVQLNQVILNGANSVTLKELDGLILNSASVTNTLNLSTGGTLLVGQAQAGNTLNLSAGQIVDNNDSALNLNAATVILRAQSGIGNGNALETQASTLNVINSGTGNVELDNTGKVTLQALQNNNNTLIFINDQDIRFQPGSTDAGFSAGTLLMTTETGSFLGVGSPDANNPDITAYAAVFIGFQGTFGTLQRPLVLNVQDSVLIQTRSSLSPIFSPRRPRIVDDRSLLQLNAFDTLDTLSGGQLIEVESLSEVDPAIFTDVRNYNTDQIAVRLPRDQLYEDELEALGEAY